MKHIEIYELTPAPWGGDNYRLVESFETLEDGKEVLKVLEKVNIGFKLYRLIVWQNCEPFLLYDSFKIGEKK